MTRQRLRESSVKWNMTLSLDSFALKVIKKSEELAFFNKVKIINASVPLKVKNYIEENLRKEINYYKEKYKLEFNIISDDTLVIPEYKIALLNKNKKIIKKIENIERIEENSFINRNHHRKNFMINRNNKNFKSSNKFKYYSKNKKNISSKKKSLNY